MNYENQTQYRLVVVVVIVVLGLVILLASRPSESAIRSLQPAAADTSSTETNPFSDLPTYDPNATYPVPTDSIEGAYSFINVYEYTVEPDNYPSARARSAFGLGGQVHYFRDPALMKDIGMTWVKLQIKEGDVDAGDKIAKGKANGFRVLLSVLGDSTRVIEPGYQAQYAQYVADLAGQGADAIEVWNIDYDAMGPDPMAGYAIIRPDKSCPACDALAAVFGQYYLFDFQRITPGAAIQIGILRHESKKQPLARVRGGTRASGCRHYTLLPFSQTSEISHLT